jgi:hypothetical protein
MKVSLSENDLSLIVDSLAYSKKAVEEAQDTPVT